MALKTECEHTEQFIICPTCEPDEDKAMRDVDDALLEGVTMVARFPGRCPECDLDVEGLQVVWDPETKRVVHTDCA